MSKTRKKPYTGSKAVDSSCRNHGSCPHCEAARKHKVKRLQPIEQDIEKDSTNA